MESSRYTSQPWTCTDFDEEQCQQQIVHNLQEQYNTVFDCLFVPAAAAGGQEGLLLTAHHSGDVRLYNWRAICSKWLSQRAQQQYELSWRPHEGSVYAIALTHFDNAHWVITAGADGHVKLWALSDILAAAPGAAAGGAAAAAEAAGPHVVLKAGAEVLLPHLQNPVGVSDGRQPTAQVLAVDVQHQQVFVGGSDGGVHAWRLDQLAAAVGAMGSAQQPAAAAAAALSMVPMPGHAAAVLGLDHCSATHQLASASEDGTVRVWDCATYTCISIIHPNPAPLKDGLGPCTVPLDQPMQLLACARSPGNTCVCFDAGGSWLLIGNAEGYLVLWSTRLNAAVAHTQCTKGGGEGSGGAVLVPQVLRVTPSTVYLAGTGRQLLQFSFRLEQLHSFEVSSESVFGLGQDADSGMVAVSGSRGCLDLLSDQGTCLGYIKPPESVFMAAA